MYSTISSIKYSGVLAPAVMPSEAQPLSQVASTSSFLATMKELAFKERAISNKRFEFAEAGSPVTRTQSLFFAIETI